MKVDVKIAGASYSEVPAVLIPLKSGGKARFCEVSDTTAKAADVAKGKTFYDADGNYTAGTNTGSGGSTSTVTATPYKVTIQQVPHQTISASFTPQVAGTINTLAKSGNETLNLESEATLGISYAFKTKITPDAGWAGGKVSVSGELENGLICGDVTITASEAVQIPTDITAPEGYTTVYLGQNKLYQDQGLTVELASKSQVEANSKIYVMDVTRNSYTLRYLFCPSQSNNAGTGFDEKCVDLSGISKSLITSLGSLFLGNSNLESADMSGFGDIDAVYSLFAYCTSLKCVYFDTLRNVGSTTINTYHTFSTCTALEYLILDNENVDFVVESGTDSERGIPSQTKVLVPRAALEAYKADSHWKSVADRILPMEDFDIVRKDGAVSVTPKGA